MNTHSNRQKLMSKDAAEIIIGSVILAVPASITEEIWTLSSELSLLKAVIISLTSLIFIAFFVQTRYSHDFSTASQKSLAARVSSVYALTMLVSAVILLGIDKLPLIEDPIVALKRTMLVAFPASFAATVVDSLHD